MAFPPGVPTVRLILGTMYDVDGDAVPGVALRVDLAEPIPMPDGGAVGPSKATTTTDAEGRAEVTVPASDAAVYRLTVPALGHRAAPLRLPASAPVVAVEELALGADGVLAPKETA